MDLMTSTSKGLCGMLRGQSTGLGGDKTAKPLRKATQDFKELLQYRVFLKLQA